MKSKYPHIFEPFTVRRMTAKNRIVMTPMGTNYGVVKTQLSVGAWTHWLKIAYIEYD